MKKSVFIFVVGLSAYLRTATADAETVWLKDVTTRFQTEKRTLSDPDLPDQLSFHLQRKSHALTLNLKRNHQIDPNADVYIVRKLKDGRSLLAKTRNLEKEAVAYYQDRENGAFMTAKCVKRSSGQCDILINGNIRIGDRNYDIRPSEVDITSRNVLESTGLLAKRYVLQDQANIQREMSVENKDETTVNEKNVQDNLINLLRRIPHEQDKQKHFLRPDVKLSIRNAAGLHNTETTEENSYSATKNKEDNIRNLKKEYYVEVFVLIDSSIWDLFQTMTNYVDPIQHDYETERKIREYFSHIINGIDLFYKGIEDSDISISVNIRGFKIFKSVTQFPHKTSRVQIYKSRKIINVDMYLADLSLFDVDESRYLPVYDQAILFTRCYLRFGWTGSGSRKEDKYGLYDHSPNRLDVAGASKINGVCEIGLRVQIAENSNYFLTTSNAAHELGHSLGAEHDGDPGATNCKAEDFFIMSSYQPRFNLNQTYSRNPWLFSNCSVKAFKKILKDKECVTSKGNYSEGELNEWKSFMRKLPGELYPPHDQCHIINGNGSTYCGKIPQMMCRFMYCTNPKTGKCVEKYLSAATGTTCGSNAWCKEGLCVSMVKK